LDHSNNQFSMDCRDHQNIQVRLPLPHVENILNSQRTDHPSRNRPHKPHRDAHRSTHYQVPSLVRQKTSLQLHPKVELVERELVTAYRCCQHW
jgi:hypothetical protein